MAQVNSIQVIGKRVIADCAVAGAFGFDTILRVAADGVRRNGIRRSTVKVDSITFPANPNSIDNLISGDGIVAAVNININTVFARAADGVIGN